MSDLNLKDTLHQIHTRGLRVLWSFKVAEPMWKDTEEPVDEATWQFIETELGQERFVPQDTRSVLIGIGLSWKREIPASEVKLTAPGLSGLDDSLKYFIQRKPITPWEIEKRTFPVPIRIDQPWQDDIVTIKYRASFEPSLTLVDELIAAGIVQPGSSITGTMKPDKSIVELIAQPFYSNITEGGYSVWESEYLFNSKVEQDDWTEEFVGLLHEYTLKPKALELIGGE